MCSPLDIYSQSISHLDEATQIKKLRQFARTLRREQPLENRREAEKTIYNKLNSLPILQEKNHFAIFLSFDGEVNTQPIIEMLWETHKSVYLPVIINEPNPKMDFILYTPQTPLKQSQLGFHYPIYTESQLIDPNQLDVVFTPLTVFDDRRYRIGMGGGFYDRFFLNYSNNYRLGIAYTLQKIAYLPNQPWDQKLNAILSD